MIEIRHAKVEDAEAIREVDVKTWRTTYTGLVDDDFITKREQKFDIERSRNSIAKSIERGYGKIVATDNDKVIGFLTYGEGRDGLEQYGELIASYILKDYQKQGIGKRLFTVAIQDLVNAGFEDIVYWGLTDNPSLAFHHKMADKVLKTRMIKLGEQELEETCFLINGVKYLEKNNVETKKIK